MNDAIIFHFPPELMNLLVQAIPRLFRSKKDVLLFFHGAGVESAMLKDLALRVRQDRDSITKYDIVRTVLTRLNDAGESALRARREVLKRVVEFEDFSTCYADDQLTAQGLAANIRDLVNAKDTITRINLERERERDAARQRRREEQEAEYQAIKERKDELASILSELNALCRESNPQRRGKALESVLNRLFKQQGILIREAFTLSGIHGEGVIEQIDGVIELDGMVFLVEMKWWHEALGRNDVATHLVSVYSRGDVGGIYISASGYTNPAINDFREALREKVVILCELREIIRLLEQEANLTELLRSKIRAAKVEKQPYLLAL